MKSLTDEQLIKQIRKSEQADLAFRELISRHQERLYHHVRRLVKNHADADDVMQNSLLKAWKALPRFRGDSAFYSWIYRIATNEAFALLRAGKRQSDYEVEDLLANTPSKGWGGPEGDEILGKLSQALNKLPAKQKLVFELRYFHEMPYGEIARKTKTSEGALKASYHHAARKIEDYLENH